MLMVLRSLEPMKDERKQTVMTTTLQLAYRTVIHILECSKAQICVW